MYLLVTNSPRTRPASLAFLGLVLLILCPALAIGGNTNVASALPTVDPRQAADNKENAWYFGVEAEAKAGRGRAQMPALIVLLNGTDPHMRTMAAQLISDIGKDASDAVPGLMQGMNDPDWEAQLRCIEALGDIGPAALPALPSLVKMLNFSEWPIDNMIVYAIGSIGPKAESACPAIEAVLQRPKNSYWQAAVSVTCRIALVRIAGKPSHQVMALIAMLDEKDDATTYNFPSLEALRGLIQLMPEGKIASDQVGQILANPRANLSTRAEAANALGVFGDPASVPFLENAIHYDPEFAVRGAAIDALGKIEGPKVNVTRLHAESATRQYEEMHRYDWLRFWDKSGGK